MELNLQTAELALREASESNPGAWADHSRFVAEACKNIASHCKDLSSEQAYIFGLLHDIGRYAGVSSERKTAWQATPCWKALFSEDGQRRIWQSTILRMLHPRMPSKLLITLLPT